MPLQGGVVRAWTMSVLLRVCLRSLAVILVFNPNCQRLKNYFLVLPTWTIGCTIGKLPCIISWMLYMYLTTAPGGCAGT